VEAEENDRVGSKKGTEA